MLTRRGALSPEQLFHLTVHRAVAPDAITHMLHTSARKVTLVEQGKKIGFGFEPGTSWPVLGELARLKVKKHPATTITAIGSQGVSCAGFDKEGNPISFTIPCDTVVVASGVHPDSSLLDALTAHGIDAVTVGNAQKLGKAMEAIRAGAELGNIL